MVRKSGSKAYPLRVKRRAHLDPSPNKEDRGQRSPKLWSYGLSRRSNLAYTNRLDHKIKYCHRPPQNGCTPKSLGGRLPQRRTSNLSVISQVANLCSAVYPQWRRFPTLTAHIKSQPPLAWFQGNEIPCSLFIYQKGYYFVLIYFPSEITRSFK